MRNKSYILYTYYFGAPRLKLETFSRHAIKCDTAKIDGKLKL